jgi:hypothetical protein
MATLIPQINEAKCSFSILFLFGQTIGYASFGRKTLGQQTFARRSNFPIIWVLVDSSKRLFLHGSFDQMAFGQMAFG